MTIELRSVRRADLLAVFDLLARSFPEAPRDLFERQALRDSTFRGRHGRVALRDGRIAGYLRIFARTMLVRGEPVAAGGIGSVATDPALRGTGIATALLEDAIATMRAEGMRLSFLFTGIPAFYERLGYRIIRQPHFTLDPLALRDQPPPRVDILVPVPVPARTGLQTCPPPDQRGSSNRGDARTSRTGAQRPITITPFDPARDLRPALALYRHATAGSTGAIVRTPRTWRDASTWLEDDASYTARRHGKLIAYARARCRDGEHQLLEAIARDGDSAALGAVIVASAEHCACKTLTALAPDDSLFAAALRSLPGVRESWDFRWPMMVRALDDDPAIERAFTADPLAFHHPDRI